MHAPEEAAMTAKPPPYTWVATPEAFDRTVEALSAAPRFAVDIEADSLYHYFEKICLIQVSTATETFVIDPLAVRDLSPLAGIFADPSVEKVFHAAGYDLHSLRRDYDFVVRNLFDTHIAAQLLGYEQLGLGALMERLLGVLHSKGRQRDDWSRRPLAPEQLEYAAMDTHHLLDLRDLLDAQLCGKGRQEWAREEFNLSSTATQSDREFDPNGFRRIKGHRELSLRELAILRGLYLLRDRLAREMDLPPFKVINNSVLVDLSRRPPSNPSTLFNRPGISFRIARKYAVEIVRAIDEARSQDPSTLILPPRPAYKPPSAEAKQRLELLKNWRQTKGAELGLPIGVVFPGTILELLATSPPSELPELEIVDGMRRWRVRLFGMEILELLARVP
jgi:ribonuclease D